MGGIGFVLLIARFAEEYSRPARNNNRNPQASYQALTPLSIPNSLLVYVRRRVTRNKGNKPTLTLVMRSIYAPASVK